MLSPVKVVILVFPKVVNWGIWAPGVGGCQSKLFSGGDKDVAWKTI